ncbi:UbiH/UbiF family hydroxylase [Tateyamaria omphalii]|uniref:2-octaprenyl-6-methoxyphenyl hydroxylase n=1 Tax=Tateyamaria omphalii TaxID=299262 RepID=A0A1P8MSR7_9RHOB|nr:UbiH/UbiF family hydroxylase [Tateyamaria omphalii]APX11120.1 2-octaprenyl-6-methoxyphenyl hydroxylase [Tateyamaria omphalii]
MTQTCDILISGGGIAGLTAAAAFGTAGFDVICVDPKPPVIDHDADGADMRTTAMLQPARALLDSAGVWDELAPHAAALEVMQIADAATETDAVREVKAFRASDVSEMPFGWNFPNWRLRRELLARLDTLPSVDFRPGTGTTRFLGRTTEARVGLSDGTSVKARLVIAADGRNSPMRQAAGIGVTTRRYGQKALAFAVTHPIPHDHVSTEVHRTGGPFTLVPLPDRDGMPCSAVVWMDDGPKSVARMALDTDAFEAEMTERSCHILGPLTLASPRSIWPIISQIAERLNGTRLALIAEAAHVVPPIGAQGLNMSLADTSTLLDLAVANPDTLGDARMLDAYHAARYRDIRMRVTGIDLLNRTSQATSPLARDARAMGLKALHEIAPVRKTLMKLGLGVQAAS